MPEASGARPLSTAELVAVIASISGIGALAVDIMLPALPAIAADLSIQHDNDRQLIVVAYIAALGVAQLIYGPLADAFGRRKLLLAALGVFLAGTCLCMTVSGFYAFLAARVMQGLGAGAARVTTNAIVRDLSSGWRMAQIASMAMTVFMAVPIIAPAVGQLVLTLAPWRWIFGGLFVYAAAIAVWLFLRLPETSSAANRTALRPREVASSYLRALADRDMTGYMIATTCMAAGLYAYLATSQQIFVDYYGLGAAFPAAFASVAAIITLGAIANARLVRRVGLRRMAHSATLCFCVMALGHALASSLGATGLWSFIVGISLTMGLFAMTGSNFNAIAMEQMGARAGVAASLFGACSAFGGAILGGLLARMFDGTPQPFLFGLAALGAGAFIAIIITERGRLFPKPAR